MKHDRYPKIMVCPFLGILMPVKNAEEEASIRRTNRIMIITGAVGLIGGMIGILAIFVIMALK